MRFEAKHKYFKNLAKIGKTVKNIGAFLKKKTVYHQS